MRTRTALAALLVVAVLGGAALAVSLGLGPAAPGPDRPGAGGTDAGDPALSVRWLSDTGRNVSGNHHAVAAGRVDGHGYVYAPISGEDRSRHCALVALHAGNATPAWSASVPPEDCLIHSVADPTLADFDRDGTPEVLAATTLRAVSAHHPGTGAVEWRHNLTSYGYTQAVVADLAPADGPEVVVADVRGTVFALRPDGAPAWSREVGGYVWAQPAVTDVDADGTPELVVGQGAGAVLAVDGDGSVRWERREPLDGSVTWLAVGQADDDAAREVVPATAKGVVAVLDGRDGRVEWHRDFGEFAAVHALGDGDGDGDPELYVVARDGVLRALDAATGETEWTTTLTTADVQMTPPPAMGDVDGDGDPELVAVANDGTVALVDPATGDVLGTYDRAVPIYTHPTLADTDGDGHPEVYVVYGDGRVVALAVD